MIDNIDNRPVHGPCMPLQEYEQKVCELYENAPPDISGEALEGIQRRELELLVKHTLGLDFPQERMDTLFRVHQAFHTWMIWHIALACLKKTCLLDKRPIEHQVADKFKRHFSTLLEDWESEALLGVNETLPLRTGR